MYCRLTLQTVINHKPAGDLSQRAERPFIVLGLPPHSSGLHSGFTPGKKKNSVVNLSLPRLLSCTGSAFGVRRRSVAAPTWTLSSVDSVEEWGAGV